MTTEEKFLAAVNVIESLPKNGPFQPSEEMMLKFNSYYKQATLGPCTSSRPSFFDYRKKEWYAWKNLGNMPKDSAMEKYIEQLSKVIETMSYTESVSKFIDLMGPFYEIVWPEDLSEDDQTIEQTQTSDIGSTTSVKNVVLTEALPEMALSTESTLDESFEMFPLETESFVSVEQVDYGYKETCPTSSPDNVFVLIKADARKAHSAGDGTFVFSSTSLHDDLIREILSASIINLKRSLDDIVEHIDSLENLAIKYKAEIEMVKSDVPNSRWWSLSPFTLAVLILWPFLLDWVVYTLRQKRSL